MPSIKKNCLTDDETFWHELVLCGIGGSTVAQAKANLSYRDAVDWFVFARQRGGLSHSERLLATITTQVNRLTGGDADISDFLPYLKSAERTDEQPAELGEVMNILSMVAM